MGFAHGFARNSTCRCIHDVLCAVRPKINKNKSILRQKLTFASDNLGVYSLKWHFEKSSHQYSAGRPEEQTSGRGRESTLAGARGARSLRVTSRGEVEKKGRRAGPGSRHLEIETKRNDETVCARHARHRRPRRPRKRHVGDATEQKSRPFNF